MVLRNELDYELVFGYVTELDFQDGSHPMPVRELKLTTFTYKDSRISEQLFFLTFLVHLIYVLQGY